MTQEEKIQCILDNEKIYKGMLFKNIPGHSFRDDILQDFYLKMFKSKNLPDTPLEILKFSKTSLVNLFIDSKKEKRYKLIEEYLNPLQLDRDEDLDDLKEGAYEITNTHLIDSDPEKFFIANLDDCLLSAYQKRTVEEKEILLLYFL